MVTRGHCQLTHSSSSSFIHMSNLGHVDEREREERPALLGFMVIKTNGHEEPHVQVTMAREELSLKRPGNAAVAFGGQMPSCLW